MYCAYALSPYFYALAQSYRMPHFGQIGASLLFGLLVAGTSQVFGLHNPLKARHAWTMLIRCLGSVLLAIGALAVLVFAIFYSRIGRYILS